MSSYFPSFNYLGVNSREKGLIVSHFDADQGEHDTFLGMEPIYTESVYGSRRLDYGARYNNVATFRITTIKSDGSDLSVADVREYLKWLTGYRQNSPLELVEHVVDEFIGDGVTKTFKLTHACDRIFSIKYKIKNSEIDPQSWSYDKTNNTITVSSALRSASVKVVYGSVKYSFIGRITNSWQYKMDARTIGLIFEFTSVSPWAYSPCHTITESVCDCNKHITINNNTDDLYSYTPVNVIFNNERRNLVSYGSQNNPWYEFTVGTATWSADVVYNSQGVGFRFDPWVDSEKNYNVLLFRKKMPLTPGNYVLSFFCWSYQITTQPLVRCNLFNSDLNIDHYFYDFYATPNQPVKYEIPITIDYTSDSVLRFVIPKAHAWARGYVYITDVQFEPGMIATPWTPAIGDFSSGTSLGITNHTIGEMTVITNIDANETISISDNMMITSNNTSKIFGNSFNFVFPRLIAGSNELILRGVGTLTFEYMHAIKIGDCAIDINSMLSPASGDDGYIILDAIPWNRIEDMPTTSAMDMLASGIEVGENETTRMPTEEFSE